MKILVVYPNGSIRPFGSRKVDVDNDTWYFYTPDVIASGTIRGMDFDNLVLMHGVDPTAEFWKLILPQLRAVGGTFRWADPLPSTRTYSHWGQF